jgi:hypothetical protein
MRNVVAEFVDSLALAGAVVVIVVPGCGRSEAVRDLAPAVPPIASRPNASAEANVWTPDADLPPLDASVEEAGPARDAAATRTAGG